jgi:MarR family transcriptional regulator, organic hydroperoxide resistance regulator
MVNSEVEKLDWRLLRTVYQTYTRVKSCLDQVFEEQGLTSEQYQVLAATKYLDAPVRITDIARWLERSTNSVSMLVDRMVKAGLLRRVRDRGDRRVVNVFLTSKGEKALKPATIAARKFARQTMLSISSEDKHNFVSLSEMINYKLLQCLNPKADTEVMLKNDIKRRDTLMKRWLK